MLENKTEFLKAIAEKSRMLIINSLMDSPKYVESIAESLQLSSATVSIHLKKLEKAGIVSSQKDQYYVIYSLNKEVLDVSLLEYIAIPKEERKQLEENMHDYEESIIKKYIKVDRIMLPKQRKKRLVILREIIKRHFEMEREYTEKEMNHIFVDLGIHDFCFARRLMIEEHLMTRDNRIYKVIQTNT